MGHLAIQVSQVPSMNIRFNWLAPSANLSNVYLEVTNDDVLLVPVTAVSKKGTDNYVWLYDDETQKIKQVRVKLGNADAKQQKLHQGWKKFKKVITKAEKSFKDGETLKAEELDPAYADLAKPTKLVKEVWLEQVAKQTPGIDSNFVTNNLTSSISLQKNCEEC